MSGIPVLRHSLADRILHWLFAASIFVLLATGILPRLGVDFAWLQVHWISGLVLVLFTLLHLGRVLSKMALMRMWIALRDFRFSGKPGKYSLAQKLMHNAVALVTLVTIVTGLLMLARIDTPFWERDPYWLDAGTWGLVYVLHGLMALIFVSVIMLHVYFALRPEKRLYLRSMIKGWISRDEYANEHDQQRWKLKDDGPR